MDRWRGLKRWQKWTFGILAGFVALVVLVSIFGEDPDAEKERSAVVPAATEATTPTAPAATTATTPAPSSAESTPPPPPRENVILTGTVTDVVDGDTIKVRANDAETTVRLIGIDTPETRHPSKPVQCFGPEASERTARILPEGERVRLETDPTQDERDRFGRLLAYVYRGSKKGARGSVNYALVSTGYAKSFIYRGEPFRYAPAFQSAERAAEMANKGLWGPPCNGNTDRPPPPKPDPPPTPETPPTPHADPPPSGRGGYSPPLPPYPPDLNCADVDGPIQVTGDDPHGLDRDGDGVACE